MSAESQEHLEWENQESREYQAFPGHRDVQGPKDYRVIRGLLVWVFKGYRVLRGQGGLQAFWDPSDQLDHLEPSDLKERRV